MPKSFASDKHALGECARCGVKMLLKFMLNDGYYPNLIVCPTCWEPRHPQESLPNVEDPVTLYKPAPENLPTSSAPVLTNTLINAPNRDNVLNWTEAVSHASMIRYYEVWRSQNVLPTASNFASSFSLLTTIQVQRDTFGAISNNPYTYTDPFASVHLELGNFYHYYVVAVPQQGPAVRSNTLPVDIPPSTVVLTSVWNAVLVRIENSWTASSSVAVTLAYYDVLRSVDGGAFVSIATTLPADPRTYNDTTVDRFSHGYQYKVVPVDILGVRGADSNITSFPRLINLLLLVSSSVPGGSNDRAIQRSFDGGQTWAASISPHLGTPYVGVAYSQNRGEVLLLSAGGSIARTTDGVNFTNLVNNIGSAAWVDMIRVDALGLYIAVGLDGSLTTQRIATSPDGVTWTRRNSVVVKTWQKLGYDPIGGKVVVISANNSTQPLLSSPDGITYTQVGATAFGWEGYEFAVSALGRVMIGDRGDTNTVQTNDYATFTRTSIPGGQTFMCYDPVHDLFVTGSTSPGIFTSPAQGVTSWTSRANALQFQGCEDMIWSNTNQTLIGIVPIQGSNFAHRIVFSTNGTSYSFITPGLPVDSSYQRILEATVEST